MISKINRLLTNRQKLIILLIFLGNLVTSSMEFISLGSIPIFVSYIINPDIIDERFKPFINIIFSFSDENNILKNFLIIIFSVFVLKNIFLGILLFLEARFIYEIRKDLTNRLFKKYISQPYLFHINTNPAKLTRNLTIEVGNACAVIFQFIVIFRVCLLFLIIGTLIILIDPKIITPILLVLGSIVFSIYKLFRSSVKTRGKISVEKKANLFQKINETIGGIKEIKIMNLQNNVYKNFNKELNIYEYQSFFIHALNSFPKIIMEMAGLLMIVLTFYFFISINKEIYEILPILSLVVLGMVRSIPSFNTLLVASHNINFQKPSLDIMHDELNSQHNDYDFTKNDLSLKNQGIDFNELIEVKNIKYNYLDRSKPVIKNISLKIKNGSKIGIIGPSGSGKTTLLNIILGLLKPDSGSVEVDGKNINLNNLATWQKHIGYVSQNIYLIDDTIKNNIALGQDKVEDKKVEEALKKANLYNFVNSLPQKSETIIGNNGIKLSGGQHQRIGIARALYHNPKILILDEATSSLDFKTEDEIFKDLELKENNKTLIIVGHRLRTVEECDIIYLLEEGRLKDSGKFKELQNKYSQLKTRLN
jgi:ATP-binding cassette, subfamily B, bacterial PglK